MNLQEKMVLQRASERKTYLTAVELPEAELFLLAESLPHFVNLYCLGLKSRLPRKRESLEGFGQWPLGMPIHHRCRSNCPGAPTSGEGATALKRTGRVHESDRVSEGNEDEAVLCFAIKAWRYGWLGRQLAKLSTCCAQTCGDP